MTTTTSSTIQVRRAQDRFHSDLGWLNSWHTFSFGEHYDSAFSGFESLRVINDDTVAPARGFGEHGHAGMEIISYVISGQLEHRDSLGNGGIIKPGEFQYMSAGRGVRHSEKNPSPTDPVHFLQIWITPREKETTPRYQEFSLPHRENGRELTLVASRDGREGSIAIQQDAELALGRLSAGDSVAPVGVAQRHWVHLISGELELLGEQLLPGDGAAIFGDLGSLQAVAETEFLLFSFA